MLSYDLIEMVNSVEAPRLPARVRLCSVAGAAARRSAG